MKVQRTFWLIAALFSAMLMLGCTASRSSSSDALRLKLAISPDHPRMTKPITLQVHVADAQGQPVAGAQVSGELTMKLMDMGVTKLNFTPKGNGDYEAQVKSVDMSGPWALAVDAKQGSAESKQTFDVNVFD